MVHEGLRALTTHWQTLTRHTLCAYEPNTFHERISYELYAHMNASRQHGTVLGIQTTESNTPPEYLYHDAVTRVTRPSRHHRGLHCVTLCDMWDVGVLKRVVHALQYVLHERCSIRTAQKTHATHLPHAVTPATRSHKDMHQPHRKPSAKQNPL